MESENLSSLISISPVIKCVYLHYSLPQPIPISKKIDFFFYFSMSPHYGHLTEAMPARKLMLVLVRINHLWRFHWVPTMFISVKTGWFIWSKEVYGHELCLLYDWILQVFTSMINGCSQLQIRCLFVSYNSISPYSYDLTCNMPNLNIRRQHSNLLISFLISFESLKKKIKMKCQAIPPW